ncbi:hypothetical protein MPSI1_002658 [Malassezia psittaci]|uniref:2-dehydropantoate 2-reductase n=1 Tax=Malassezia psittaci TaxID=1821823 RepID=A0AAF0JES7_9BASI|nr:hypothetical protein MPSI1_002658 [Malassezia psittaci]
MPTLPRVSVAPSLRRHLPRPEESGVTLLLREKLRAQTLNKPAFGSILTIERDGAKMQTGGYTVEFSSTAASAPARVMVSEPGGDTHVAKDYDTQAPIDCLVVTTKADSTLAALRRFVHRITPATTVVLVQNGMGVLESLLDNFWRDPSDRPNFILASVTHGCFLKHPLHTVHAAFGAMHFAILPNTSRGSEAFERSLLRQAGSSASYNLDAIPQTPKTDTLRKTAALLLSMPLDVHWEPIRQFQLRALRKVIVNACINPTTALVDCRNGALFGQSTSMELFASLCEEASQVLQARARDARAHSQANESDIAMLSSLPMEDLLTQTDVDGLPLLDASLRPASMLREVERVIQSTAPNWSSMHQDVMARRASTEIDYINGYLSELGRNYGIPTPINDTLVSLVKLKTQRRTGELVSP